MKLFNPDHRLMRFLSRIGDLMLLNLAFLVGCLPVATIGASWAALYAVIFRIRNQEDGQLVRHFFRAWKQNLKQSVPEELILAAIGFVLYMDWNAVAAAGLGAFWVAATIILIAVLCFAAAYTPPLTARFDSKPLRTIRNALRISVLHPLRSAWLSVLFFFPVILFAVSPAVFLAGSIVWAVIGFAGTAWLSAPAFLNVFALYEPRTPENSEA